MADLGGDDTPVPFSAHPNLPAITAEILDLQYRAYLCGNRWAAKLGPDFEQWAANGWASFSPERFAHLDLSVAASVLRRLSASDAAGQLAFQLFNRHNRAHRKYFYPSFWSEAWRYPRFRGALQRYVKKQHGDEFQLFSPNLRTVAHNEREIRAIQLALLLIEQAVLAAQPLRPEEIDRRIDNERQCAECLRRAEYVDEARLHEQHAAEIAREYERDFCTEAERENAMIRAAARWLIRYFWMRGDRLVAGLVGEALERVIKPDRVRRIVLRVGGQFSNNPLLSDV